MRNKSANKFVRNLFACENLHKLIHSHRFAVIEKRALKKLLNQTLLHVAG